MADGTSQPLDIIHEVQRRHLPRQHLTLSFGDVIIEVRSNSVALIERLANYYNGFCCQAGNHDILVTAIESSPLDLPLRFTVKRPDPDKKRIKEEYADLPDGRVVRKRLTGMVFIFGKGAHLAVGPCIKNDNQVTNFINNRFIERMLQRGYLLGHAAGVSRGGKGLALAGFSGMGKSTLALRLMNHDCSYISNDRLMIKKTTDKLIMCGVPKMPRVNPGTILNNSRIEAIIPCGEREKLRGLSLKELWTLEQKHDVSIKDFFGSDRFVLFAEMTALVILNWQHIDSPPEIKEVNLQERGDLLKAFMKEAGLFYHPVKGDDEMATYHDFSKQAYFDCLSSCSVYELGGGIDFEKGAEMCIEIMDSFHPVAGI